jgi:hypothetical protein
LQEFNTKRRPDEDTGAEPLRKALCFVGSSSACSFENWRTGARDIVDTVVSEANMNPYAIGAIDISDGNITVDVRAAVQDRVIQF